MFLKLKTQQNIVKHQIFDKNLFFFYIIILKNI